MRVNFFSKIREPCNDICKMVAPFFLFALFITIHALTAFINVPKSTTKRTPKVLQFAVYENVKESFVEQPCSQMRFHSNAIHSISKLLRIIHNVALSTAPITFSRGNITQRLQKNCADIVPRRSHAKFSLHLLIER